MEKPDGVNITDGAYQHLDAISNITTPTYNQRFLSICIRSAKLNSIFYYISHKKFTSFTDLKDSINKDL